MADRLKGEEYRNYWRTRMAKGAEEASFCGLKEDVDPQADEFWKAISGELESVGTPFRVLEFGSGYGRMLSRMRKLWPKALLWGIELTPAAADKSWQDNLTQIICAEAVPDDFPKVEVVITCTALQHITDDEVFSKAVHSIEKVLEHNGSIVCLENIKNTDASHMRSREGIAGYTCAFNSILWKPEPKIVYWRGEPHAVISGVKSELPE